ncbi:MAG: hypothetical protein ABR915_14490 [Thermoguttaceae bacterium]|jgi:hypothetical protein
MTTAALGEIERIVREVLSAMGVSEPHSAKPQAADVKPGTERSLVAAEEVVVSARVVTMAAVADRLQTARRLVVSAGALVTPAVRDELRRRNVTLVRAAADAKPGTERSLVAVLPRLVLVAARTRHDPAPLAEALGQEGIEVRRQATDCLVAATDELAREVTGPGALGLLWMSHTAAGLCLANRHPGVRAVLATDLAGTAAATAAVGANVLVVDPLGATAFQQRRIAGEFCRGGARACPEALKERLG